MTVSESEFELFLNANRLGFSRVEVAPTRRPDYIVRIGELQVYFEVKELSEDENFEQPAGHNMTVSSRTVGEHVRERIRRARKQIQYGANLDFPSVLLIYNNIDRWHAFGTEDMDFLHAMYGEHTVLIRGNPPKIVDSFYGRNARLQPELNTSFSAVGRLAPVAGVLTVTLFENVYATNKIAFEKLPSCFDVQRIELE